MSKIAIYGSTISEEYYPSVHTILKTLEQANFEIYIFTEFAQKLQAKKYQIDNYKTFETVNSNFANYAISLGGDGTFLKCAHLFYTSSIPILGINLGKLGFLAEIMPEDIHVLIDRLVKNNFSICKRSVLDFKIQNKSIAHKGIGLNEITLQKSNHLKLIKINISINNNFLYSFWADGVIISTPTGSTGYSLSLGGPIITPDSKTLLITPIAPHTLSVRPIIIPDNSNITIEATGEYTDYLISNDFQSILVDSEPCVTIKKSTFTVNTIQFNDFTFFDILRKKLQLGIDIRK